ncbi:uncharacterized protein NPIL_478131 [Nephila pilipes]|uniref:Endonuclease/exonuclease/phosphatase domain-containing protein n=1 Tax=Nephila pilipes TaxID=299642 RepID=A0A8X6U7B7_NEPPI|nr:uncharacterized protein NPIL_478131 [Nephila pilipes]
MGTSIDKSEIVKTQLQKEETFFKIFALYIPPNSKPDLSSYEIFARTIIIGDMNAHSGWWWYSHPNAAGLEFEDLLNSSPLELSFKPDDPPTYIHYNGYSCSPGLYVSSDICAFTKRKIM